tara:strand:- start:142 stop:363 length:222 start_codon:yes stop_codon:yes gene_type:complete
MKENVKSYLTEAYEGYTKSLVQVDEFLAQQEKQLSEAKAHRERMVVKIQELKEMLNIEETEESVTDEPEVAPV